MQATWYPITDSAGNYRLDDPERSGTFVDSDGIIHNGWSWQEAQQHGAVKAARDLPVVVEVQ
jgi:hypothetical protein